MRGDRKRGWVIAIIVIILLIAVGFIFIVSAYKNGTVVVQTPQVQWVSHTEYWSSSGPGSGEVASTIIRLTDYKGDPFEANDCKATILYPNKSVYVSNQPMSQSTIPGNWYRADVVPRTEGTYEQSVTCTYGSNKTVKTSQSFHVNPALNYIKNVSLDVLANGAKLESVNLSISGKVNDAKSVLNAKIEAAQGNLTSLVTGVNSSIINQLNSVKGDLSTQISNAKIDINARIAETNETLYSRISLAETNLNSLLSQINNNLSNQLTATSAGLDSKLTSINVTLSGIMNNVEANIIAKVNASETSLNNLINQVNTQLSDQVKSAKGNLSEQIRDVNVTLSAQLGDTKTAIQTQISNVNSSISELVKTLNNDIKNYLMLYLPSINQTATSIYADTRWLVENSMNQEDYGRINNRFSAIDGNLTMIEQFCSNVQTNSSKLCQDLSYMRNVIDTSRQEQTSYFNNLNETATNTWNLLSGDITIRINALLEGIGLIKGQTEEINKTLSEWKASEESRVYIQSIS